MKTVLAAAIVMLIVALTPFDAAGQAPAPKMTPEQVDEGCSGPGPELLPARMPPIPEENYTAAQKETVTEFHKVRKSSARGVFGPYVALLRSPEVLEHTVKLGYYLQFGTSLPHKIEQWATIITARQWSQQYMWNVHCRRALEEGVKAKTTKALLFGQRPTDMAEDEALAYDFIDEMHRTKTVSDETYARALKMFGEQGIIDLIGVNAYYSFLAMAANIGRLPVGAKTKPNLPLLPR
jgi:4-carboxymuconolactone decarboxylase